ncbi:RecT family recombinase [Acetomicrobium sp.]|uniref:RecT family recombinase n=1 Tax=Acetomicrobium sp. TaxID=1872099 RepID=UPI001BCB3D4D|nr:RecT family recombinase [Acetomicrobium sp.]
MLPAIANSDAPWSKEQIELIKRTVAKGASDDELKLFLHLASRYDLDPFTRQIWFIKYGDDAHIFTGRDGFLHIAHRSGAFNGMQTHLREEPVPFEIKFFNKRDKRWDSFKRESQFIATCTVFRKDMSEPFVCEVWESEYSTGQGLWPTKRRVMIQKVAEASTLRRAFDISGLYLPEEVSENEVEVVSNDRLAIASSELKDALLVKASELAEVSGGETDSVLKKVCRMKNINLDNATENDLQALIAHTDLLIARYRLKAEIEDTAELLGLDMTTLTAQVKKNCNLNSIESIQEAVEKLKERRENVSPEDELLRLAEELLI